MLPSYISWKKRQAIFMVKNWPTLLWPILRVKGEIWPEVTLEHIAAYHAHLPHIYLISLIFWCFMENTSPWPRAEKYSMSGTSASLMLLHATGGPTWVACHCSSEWHELALTTIICPHNNYNNNNNNNNNNYNHLSSHGQAGDLQGRWVCTGQHIQSGHSWRRKYLENKFLLLYSDSPLNDDATQGGAHKCEDIACQGSWPALTHSISQSD